VNSKGSSSDPFLSIIVSSSPLHKYITAGSENISQEPQEAFGSMFT